MSKPRPSLETIAIAGSVALRPDNVVPRPAPAGSGRRDKPHDLYIEGINLMLRSYGKGTVDEIAPNVTTFPR